MLLLHDGYIRAQDVRRRHRDPTESHDARMRLETLCRIAITQWKADIRNAVVAQDALGLAQVSLLIIVPQHRMERVLNLIRATAEHRLIAPLDDTFRTAMRAVYQRGYQKACEELKPATSRTQFVSHSNVYQTVAGSELRGIVETSLQAAARVMGEIATSGTESPLKFFRRLVPVFRDIALRRLVLMANTMITMAYNGGKLDAYETLGLLEVNVLPEMLPAIRVHDAHRSRAEGMMTILTAGDDRVCFECDDLAGQTFSISEARGLLPVHPNCRCAVVPTDDRRFADPSSDAWTTDFNPNHEPSGPTGGQFASGGGGGSKGQGGQPQYGRSSIKQGKGIVAGVF